MRQRGFTLIEIMVAISITAVLGALGIAGFANYNKAQVLQTSTNEVVSMLNLAKSRAQSQIKLGASCSSQALSGYRVDILTNSYSLYSLCGTPNLITSKTLPQNLIFGSAKSFFFPIQTGRVQWSGTGTPWKITISDGNSLKTININPLGGVSIQ